MFRFETTLTGYRSTQANSTTTSDNENHGKLKSKNALPDVLSNSQKDIALKVRLPPTPRSF
jgi:hypothetical protein